MLKKTPGICLILVAMVALVTACSSTPPPPPTGQENPGEEMSAEDNANKAVTIPDWFNVELTDVNTGKTFRIADFQGKVILLETMAIWCPTCTHQQQEIQALHEMLGERDDFVSVSLDVDSNESEDMLKAYAAQNGFDWKLAVAPLEVSRALGNLYSAEYLNPPLAPMMIINPQGQVFGLPFGGVKKATNLKPTLETYFKGDGLSLRHGNEE
jgi:peroxiredoxin